MKRKKFNKIKNVISLMLSTVLFCSSFQISIFASENNGYELYPIPHEISYYDGTVDLKDTVNVFFESGIDEYTVNRAEYALERAGLVMIRVDNPESYNMFDVELIRDDLKQNNEEIDKEETEQNKEEIDKEETEQNKEEINKEETEQNKEEIDKEETEQNREEINKEETEQNKEEIDKEETEQNREEINKEETEQNKEEINKKETEQNKYKNDIDVELEGNDKKEGKIEASLNLYDSEKIEQDIQIYVGIYNNDDSTVDNWFNENGVNKDYEIFNKTDSYLLLVKNNKIAILGKDTDSAFYGLTTLKQIMDQSRDGIVKELYIKDWADVLSRGFIEGYYGEPWSTEDRIELMKFGGEIKLNSYFYAPKDDPKHNSKWWELYTQQELEDKIAPLAKAGNESKCQFVYALHPFMHNAINEDNYDGHLELIKKKFTQVLDNGVRQISILADDAAVPKGGAEIYIRLMKDLVDWVSLPEMQKKYDGLKTTIPFCPNDYMGDGSSEQLQKLKNLPATVPIVMTGGRVWGEVSEGFTNKFKNNVERGPYLWINWPCTDNSKRHLIMGGFKDFLHTGVNPENIEGIVLNPMQQSEPSKVAIFGNGCYSWNIWDSDEQADKAWYDSFKYVDHKTYRETEASTALREISKHMINQNMDSRVRVLEESIELAPKLKEFNSKLNSGTITKNDIDDIRKEFSKLQQSARVFKEKGNKRIVGQIIYWLDTWENITNAVLIFMDALEEYYVKEDSSNIPSYYTEAQAQMEEAETHGFSYIDHMEYAEVGVQHIMPFVRKIRDKVAEIAEVSVNPTKVIFTPITNRTDEPVGGINSIKDKNFNTKAVFKTPNSASEGTYIGLKFNKPIDLNSVRFEMGDSRNEKNNSFNGSRIEYTEDGTNWKSIEEFQGKQTIIEKDGLNLKARGVRLVCTNNTENIWISVREIYVNDSPIEVENINDGLIKGRVEKTERYQSYQNSEGNLIDGNDETVAWYSMNGNAEKGDFVGLNFGEDKKIGRVRIIVGAGDADKWNKYHIEYKASSDEDWHKLEEITGKSSGKDIVDIDLKGALASQVRIVNDEQKPNWIKFSEFQVFEYALGDVIRSDDLITSDDLALLQDKSDETSVTFNDSKKGSYIGLKLLSPKKIGNIRLVMGSNENSNKKWNDYHLEYSPDAEGDNWINIRNIKDISSKKNIIDLNLGGVTAWRIRIVNDESVNKPVSFSEITVDGYDFKKNTNEHIVSNNNDLINGSYGNFNSKEAIFKNSFEMTLRPNDYIGIRLPRISHISNIIFDGQNIDKLKLKVGINNSEMNYYDSNSNKSGDLRYIYITNTTDDNIKFTLDELKVFIDEPTGVSFDSLHDLPLAPSWNTEDAVEKRFNTGNWFDGNQNTSAVYCRYPKAGSWILFDLGQVRDIENIEMVVGAQEKNFIRSGKIQVSMEKDSNEWIDVVKIGSGSVNNSHDDTIAQDFTDTNGNIVWTTSGPNLVSVKSDLDKPVKARYLRVYFDASYDHRFITANEIVINDGEYVPINGNPTFIVDPPEISAEFLPENMIDGNITTGFKPNMSNLEKGYFEYKLSEKTNIAQINILQSSSAISNARVYVRGKVSNTSTAEVIEKANSGNWVLVSTLTEALNSVYTYDFDEIYEIRVEWDNNINPFFYEIALVQSGILPIDTTELENIYKKYGEITDIEKYDKDLLDKYNEVRYSVKEFLDNHESIKEQAQVNRMYNMLRTAYKNLISSVEDLEIAKENLIKQIESYVEKDYTSKSWNTFINSDEYKHAIELKNSSLKEPKIFVDATLELIKAGDTILQSIYDISTLKSLLESVSNIDLDPYTFVSCESLKVVVKRVERAIKKEDISSDEIAELYNELIKAVEKLVRIDSIGASGDYDGYEDNNINKSESVSSNNNFENSLTLIEGDNKTSFVNSKGESIDIISNKNQNGIKISFEKDGENIASLDENIKIGIPLDEQKNDMGLVAIVVDEYGNEHIVKNSYLQNGNMVLNINKTCTIKLENRSKKFDDVDSVSWFKNSVDFVTARGLFSGKTNVDFAPDDEMTRGMLTSVIYRFANEPQVVFNNSFSDINSNMYYSDAIAWATQNGFVSGIGENIFAPDNPITREQLVTILYRYAGSPKVNEYDLDFDDKNEISDYALDSMMWAVSNNIVSGRNNKILAPKGDVTRAEVSTILMNLIVNEKIK